MNEYIITFLQGQLTDEKLFHIDMTGITYPDPRYRIRRTNSKILCLEYIIRGKGEIEENGKHYTVRQGDVYLLMPGRDHEYYSDPEQPWEKIWMNVQGSLCETLVEGYGLGDQVVFCNCPLYPLFRNFLSVCESYDGRGRQMADRAVLLFCEIIQKLAEHQAGTKEHTGGAVWQMKEYIDGHIYEKLSVPKLAEQVNLSVSQAGRLFKAAYGKTPYEYILERKTDTACLLLENTGLSVKEIAYRLNFADEHYFSNVFRKRMGKTPGGYRGNPKKCVCENLANYCQQREKMGFYDRIR